MFNISQTEGTITKNLVNNYLMTWIEAFLIDRKVRGLANGTLRFYRIKLKLFTDFWETQVVTKSVKSPLPYFANISHIWKRLVIMREASMRHTALCAPFCTGMRMKLNQMDGRIPSVRSKLRK